MRTLIEVTDHLRLDYYFVDLTVRQNILIIKSLRGLVKTLSAEIPLDRIEILQYKKNERYSFIYEGITYTIVDYGNGVLKNFP
ncbi:MULTISPECIES: hypothetical protein [unclassified Enterococcus]|uniref:hypothetical protein n=1 Tax=unclassified Enterococcus TaxID=2608891 RepID=UPI0015538F80|nr:MULTISPECIES: hypothetical protein [unclassified Enterococcus]MBS7576934.1 hypothetical protein [Enterococcus sp. MMGLQ5-2]MBS7584341.1 hypothetical protein [Enterococcus sp. MMGLQ5-1]NPD12197.1 hypothetical protein [Enterococcus sp. MMGLQ5-1]NPD36769.1 hypothetical protein [Enterococcus sp. MMGLQ5-2]